MLGRTAEEIFDEVRGMDEVARSAYLENACGDDVALRAMVDVLLQADAAGLMATINPGGGVTVMPTPTGISDGDPTAHPESGVDATIRTPMREGVGETIGRYKLLQQIGEGGFGSVWMAEQREPVKRRVALKIIKLGMDTKQVIARFEAERQALAMMDHPNIAKVLDAGSTETGRPYFVMELVKGVPILDYCDTERLDTNERLQLFVEVCHAIQHAHQKGIIHRDIKPSNVLVTLHDGVRVPKVIDFGIAKATSTELTQKTLFTEQRQIIGTPAYMSPEQAEMTGLDIDTRSDIYSLGVLLYELLTGTTPFDIGELMEAGFGEMMKIIREAEPHRPSARLSTLGHTASLTAEQRRADPKRLHSQLRGDLDWIVMKCLEKDRTRRYETANALAEDIQRHTRHEPVSAGPPSTQYKLRKFVRRHRGRVVAGSFVAVAIVLAIIGTTGGMLWAISERDRAETAESSAKARAQELEQVAAFQSSQLSEIDVEAMGAGLRQRLADEVEASLKDQGLSEAEVADDVATFMKLIADTNFTNLSLSALDDHIFERALNAIDADFDAQPLIKARLLQTVGTTLRDLGLLDRAMEPQAEALEIRRDVMGDEHDDTLSAACDVGFLLLEQGRFSEADPYLTDVLTKRTEQLTEDHPETLFSMNRVGLLRAEQGSYEESERILRSALEGRRRVLGNDHIDTITSVNNMGYILWKQKKLDEAEPFWREALEGRRRLLSPDHPEVMLSLNNLGILLFQQGKHADAVPYFRDALAGRRRVLGDNHVLTLTSMHNMGRVLRESGQYDEANAQGSEAIERARTTLPAGHWQLGSFLKQHSETLLAMGRYTDAEREALEAHSILAGSLGLDHDRTRSVVEFLVELYESWDKAEPNNGYAPRASMWRSRLDG